MVVAGRDDDDDPGVECAVDRRMCQIVLRPATEAHIDDVAFIGHRRIDRLGDVEIARAAACIWKHAVAPQGDARRDPAEAAGGSSASDDAGNMRTVLAFALRGSPIAGCRRIVPGFVAYAIEAARHVRQIRMLAVDAAIDNSDSDAITGIRRQRTVKLGQQQRRILYVYLVELDFRCFGSGGVGREKSPKACRRVNLHTFEARV